ncbi:serine hydrolase [Larkinella soli]|uniref:serine hydrolase n=1 Tax=Larkinella soli TaxID=1770527 RepID=UPI000FFC88D1|nr:serine hydrolase [Larkinella soli]
MKRLILIFTLLAQLAQAQSGRHLPPDSVASLVRRHYNDRQPDSIYALAGEVFRRQISAEQFRLVTGGLFGQTGRWKSVERRSTAGEVVRYKAVFERAKMDFHLSLDAQGKLHTFLFRPFEEDLPDRKTPALSSNPLRTAFDREVDTVVQPYIRRQNTVGLSIGLLRNDSLWVYGYGETGRDSGKIPDETTLFEIGSITKTFTATLLMDAVRRGEVRLDDPINRYLPDSIPALQKDGIPVTLKTLSNHTSGLPRLPANLFTFATNMNNPYRHYGRKELYAFLKTVTLPRRPGEQYEYSNLAVGLLGTVLENVAGKPFEELVRERITRPLGMEHTVIALGDQDKAAFAQGHDAKGNPVSSWEFQALTAAGGIRSDVRDLIRYLKAELGNGPARLVSAMKQTQETTFKNGDTSVGLGWHRRTEAARPWYWHQGGTGGFVTFTAFNPDRRTAVVLLTNSQNPIDTLTAGLLSLLEKN